jgi:hypothetical protein
MKPHILFLLLRFEGIWELNDYKTNILLNRKVKSLLLDFVENNHGDKKYFRQNGNARRFCILNQTDTPITDLMMEYRKEVFRNFGIPTFEEEPMFGIFLGVNTETGFVHEHTDPAKPGYYHVRLNFLVSKPFDGGMPVINGEEFEIEEDQCWINLASEWKHNSTPVVGDRPRIVLSLGALVEKTKVDYILKVMGIN